MTGYGFVGLGQIGAPMARRAPAALVYDVRAEAMEGFENTAGSLEEIAERADVISVMVRDDEQVREVAARIVETGSAGTVVALHSTIAPATAEELAGLAAEKGIDVVDAPVSGGAVGAGDGTLAVMVGGEDAAVNRCRDPFSAWSSLFVHTGPVGSATRMKLARNLLTFVSFVAAGEAQRLAAAFGLDLLELGKIVRHSDGVTGGPGAIMFRDSAGPVAVDDPRREILVHTCELGRKDLALAIEAGRRSGVDLPMASLGLERLASSLGVAHD